MKKFLSILFVAMFAPVAVAKPKVELWNPDSVGWEDIPAGKRPMIQLERPIFSRDTWTHVAFTLENINAKDAKPAGRLYLNGEPQGAIENRDLTFGWDPASVLLVIGAAYAGHLDELALFNRVLNEAEVQEVYGLPGGVRSLYGP